jgi:hypothetical protein
MKDEYTTRQFERLGDTSKPYDLSLKIVSSEGQTNYLNITEEELLQIRAILIKGKAS